MELRLGPLCRWANRALAIRAGAWRRSRGSPSAWEKFRSRCRRLHGRLMGSTDQAPGSVSVALPAVDTIVAVPKYWAFFARSCQLWGGGLRALPAHRNDEIERPANPQANSGHSSPDFLFTMSRKKTRASPPDRRCELKDLQTIMHWDKRETVTR